MSDNPRDRHTEAVGFAGLKVEDMQRSLHVAMEKMSDEVLPAITAAVGAHPDSQAGNEALGMALAVQTGLELMLGTCEAIKEQLNGYSQGL